MVVTAIPEKEKVDLGKYIITDKKDPEAATNLLNRGTLVSISPNEKAMLGATVDATNPENIITTYTIYNTETLATIGDPMEASAHKMVDVSFESNYYYTVETYEIDDEGAFVGRTIAYYTYDGKQMASQAWNSASDTSWETLFAQIAPSTHTQNGVVYLPFSDKVWAMDEVTSEVLLENAEKMGLVYRPAFDQVCEGKYGYIEKDGKINVYDLTKWIDCVGTYDIPDNYVNSDWFVLSNGTILVQGVVYLDPNAVSYDLLESGAKLDLVYTVVDVVKETAKAVEFGYMVIDVTSPDEEFFTDKAENIAVIAPIVSGRISTLPKTVILNNDMTIAADVTEAIEYRLVADELFIKEEEIGLTDQIYIVDVNGDVKAYVPYSADIMEEYIYYNGKVYNFLMEEKLDFAKAGLGIRAEYPTYMIVFDSEESTNYYYDMQTNKKTEIDTEHASSFNVQANAFGYIVTCTFPETVEYKVYNFNGVCIEEIEHRAVEFFEINGTPVMVLADGTFVFAY